MVWFGLIVGALLITLLIGAIFSFGGIRGPGDSLLTFFVVLFLGSLAIGTWLDPIGPRAFGFPWLSFLIITLFLALLVAASTPLDRARRRRIKRLPLQRDTRIEPDAEPVSPHPPAAAETLDPTSPIGIFFWVFLVVALSLVMVRFFQLFTA